MNGQIKLTLPNEISYLPVAEAVVREAARRCNFDESALIEIEVGVEEAVTNVMKHAYDIEENPTFDIICQPLPNGLQIVLRENGIPFDPKLIPRYRPELADLNSSSAGMGFHLMRAMMDDVQLVNLGSQGKETRLVKLHKNAAAAAQENGPTRTAATEPEVIQEKLAYEVRLMGENEAIEVSKCAFKSHGYSFFDDHIYYPDRLVELNKSGAMISAVAVTKDNAMPPSRANASISLSGLSRSKRTLLTSRPPRSAASTALRPPMQARPATSRRAAPRRKRRPTRFSCRQRR